MDEWKVDKHGQRYRETAPGHREYEMLIQTTSGLVPESQLAEHNKRVREAEARRKAAEMEALKNQPVTKYCVFSSGMNNACRREKCNLFYKGKCSIAAIADASGMEIEGKPNGKCPFSVYGRCESCAMFNHGCAIVRLAAATYKE